MELHHTHRHTKLLTRALLHSLLHSFIHILFDWGKKKDEIQDKKSRGYQVDAPTLHSRLEALAASVRVSTLHFIRLLAFVHV